VFSDSLLVSPCLSGCGISQQFAGLIIKTAAIYF
jgi:hypothetical protein